MLLENFDSAFLNGVVKRIEDHLADYQALYYSAVIRLKKMPGLPVPQGRSSMGLLHAIFRREGLWPKFQSSANPKLTNPWWVLGEGWKNMDGRAEQTAEQLQKSRDDYVGPFIDNIKMVDALYNHPVEVVFDKKASIWKT